VVFQKITVGAAFAAALLLLGGCQTLPGPDTRDLVVGQHGLTIHKNLRTWRDMRYKNVVHQQFDYSCGAAALATLLEYHYGDVVAETDIIGKMLRLGDQERIRREGFSLLDLKRFADERGYVSRAFKMGPEVLDRLTIPAVTLIDTRGFSHFVVIKGARDGKVYLADPALGSRVMPMNEFLREWREVVLFVAAKRGDDEPSPLQHLEPNLRGRRDQVVSLRELGAHGFSLGRNEF